MSDRSPFLNALIGAAVSVVLAFIPFSSLLGGAVAGYLEGGEVGDGLKVGALSGLLAAVPIVLVLVLVGGIIGLGFMGLGGPRMFALGGAFVVVVFLFVLVYLVAFSALGGALGAAVSGDPNLYPQAEE